MDCLPVRPLIKYNSGDGAWIIAQKADQRKRFKAIICALKSIDKNNQIYIKNNPDQKLGNNTKFSKEMILEHCKTVDPDKIAIINVSFHDLESSEDEFYEFSSVYKIDACKNRLNLDDFITFVSLVELNLSSNGLKNININPQDFEHLQILDVSFNNLTNEDILMLGLLRKLKTLILIGNNLRTLPVDMVQSYMGEDGKCYPRFNKLEELNIEYNQLHSVNSFSALGGLPKLRILKLAHNDFDSIPLLKCIKLVNQIENNYRKTYEFEIDDEEEMEDYQNSFFNNKNMEIRIPSTLHEVEEETTNRTTIDTKNSEEEEHLKISDELRLINEVINEIIDTINFHEITNGNYDREKIDNSILNQDDEITDISNLNEMNENIEKDNEDENVHKADNNQNNEQPDDFANETLIEYEKSHDNLDKDVNDKINENYLKINEDSNYVQSIGEKEINIINEIVSDKDNEEDFNRLDIDSRENIDMNIVNQDTETAEISHFNDLNENIEKDDEDENIYEVNNVINLNNQNNEETDDKVNETLIKNEKSLDNFDEDINEKTNENYIKIIEDSNCVQSTKEKEINSINEINPDKDDGKNCNGLDIDETETCDKEDIIHKTNEIEINNTKDIENFNKDVKNKKEIETKDELLETKIKNKIEIDRNYDNSDKRKLDFSTDLSTEDINGNDIKIIIDRQHSKISDEIIEYDDDDGDGKNNDDCVKELIPQTENNEGNHLYLLEQHNKMDGELNNNSPELESLQHNCKKWSVDNPEKENTCHSLIIVNDFLNFSSISDIIRQISASSFGENLPKPFPSLEYLDLSFNKVKSERALIPIIAWLNLRKLSIYNNPISMRKSQKSSFIKALLENTFKIIVEWLPPILKEKPNPTIKKSKLKLSDTITTIPNNCRKTNIFPALSVKEEENNLILPKLMPLPNIVNQSVKTEETENNMVLAIKESLEEMDNENDNNQSIKFIGKNKSLLLKALRHRVEHPITYFERNVNLFERNNSLQPKKKTKVTTNYEAIEIEKRSELIATVIEKQKNRSLQSEISLDQVLSKEYINGNRKKKHESEIALKALRNMQKKYNQVRLESLKKEY